jgi:hypothetical protein
MQEFTPSEIAAALGRIRTEKKSASSRANILKARERLEDEDVKERRKEAQQARRERERQERERLSAQTLPAPKRKPGRPRKPEKEGITP